MIGRLSSVCRRFDALALSPTRFNFQPHDISHLGLQPVCGLIMVDCDLSILQYISTMNVDDSILPRLAVSHQGLENRELVPGPDLRD